MKNLISAIAVCLLCGTTLLANPVKFYEGDLVAAREKAAAEGKLFFVDFYAKWCMPCKWMDQTTFSDPRVGQLMNEEYVSVKVNIDDLVGFNLSEKYDIQVLPTILIFNEEGHMIDRIEETMTPSKMLTILEGHLQSKSRPMTRSVNRSPRATNASAGSGYAAGLPQKSSYRLQMGAYQQYEAAAAKVTELQDLFLEPIVVVNDVQDQKVLFKIMMGHFTSREEAEGFQRILKDRFKMDAFIQ